VLTGTVVSATGTPPNVAHIFPRFTSQSLGKASFAAQPAAMTCCHRMDPSVSSYGVAPSCNSLILRCLCLGMNAAKTMASRQQTHKEREPCGER
jgi:hypothetical protein